MKQSQMPWRQRVDQPYEGLLQVLIEIGAYGAIQHGVLQRLALLLAMGSHDGLRGLISRGDERLILSQTRWIEIFKPLLEFLKPLPDAADPIVTAFVQGSPDGYIESLRQRSTSERMSPSPALAAA